MEQISHLGLRNMLKPHITIKTNHIDAYNVRIRHAETLFVNVAQHVATLNAKDIKRAREVRARCMQRYNRTTLRAKANTNVTCACSHRAHNVVTR